jgi:hypothetical protein
MMNSCDCPDRVLRMNTVKWMILAVLISLLTSICLAAEKSDAPKPAQSTDELRQQLEKILKDTHTNGVSVAIVHKDGPEWVTGLGIADVASGRAATSIRCSASVRRQRLLRRYRFLCWPTRAS